MCVCVCVCVQNRIFKPVDFKWKSIYLEMQLATRTSLRGQLCERKNYCQIAVLYILCFLKKTTLFLKKKSHDAVQTYFEKQINNQVQTSKRQKSEI